MNNESPNDFDKRLDALLRKRAVKTGDDFTAKTLARLHAQPEISDETLDDLLARMPVTTSADFTARTVRAATRRTNYLAVLMPALSAAAAVADCLAGIHLYENHLSAAALRAAQAQSHADLEELSALASNLGDAEPLLDSNATESLSGLTGGRE